MNSSELMQVTLRLPTRTLFSGTAKKVFAVAENGAFGLLPKHTDFVSALVPSILVLTNEQDKELFFAVDEGLLVKIDFQVDITIRRGLQGDDLASLNEQLTTTFMAVDEDERIARSALSRLEAGIVRRFADLRKPTL